MDYQDLQDYVEERTGKSGNGGAWAGFLIGAGVGILAGILLAPRSGRDTIKQVSDKSGEWKSTLTDLINKAGSVASEYADKGRKMASDYADKGRDMASDYADKGRDMASKAANRAKDNIS